MTFGLDLVVPGRLDQRTGGYLYDRRMVDGLRAASHEVGVHELDGAFPIVDDAARAAAAGVVRRLGQGGRIPLIDGLALPAFRPDQLAFPFVALVHHPLPLETGLDAPARTALRSIEAALLRIARRIIVTSPSTREDLRVYDLDPERIAVVVPGTDPAPIAEGGGGDPPVLLAVGTLTPRKGHLLLIEALAMIADRPWRLVCCGSDTRDPPTSRAVRAAVAAAGLGDRIQFLGELAPDALADAYASADLMVSASYHEGYGMALTEALARGLPVVATAGGAVAHTVPGDAGLLVRAGDAAALAAAIARVLDERGLHEALRAGAAHARLDLPSWQEQAARFAAEMRKVLIA